MRLRTVFPLFVSVLGVSACSRSIPASPGNSTGQTRTYYIAADEVMWDYVSGGVDGISGEPFKSIGLFPSGPNPLAKPVAKAVGTSFVKALYREYTDETFKTLKPRAAEWEHLGFLGPVIRAEVGDTIRVVFRNNAKQRYSIHPHGVFYNKDSEVRTL